MRWPWSRKAKLTFDGPPMPIDLMWQALSKSTGTTATRSEALSVPAVRRGRNMLCSVATMVLEEVSARHVVQDSALLRQIDPDVANSVTIAQTVEDLVFDGISWWLVTAQDMFGFPAAARHLDVANVSLNPPGGRNPSPLPSGIDPRSGVVWVEGEPVGADRVIRFDSLNPALLRHAGREIRRAVLLDKAAAMYADDPRPADYFSPASDAEEISDEEAEELLGKWKTARKARSTAWVPNALTYHVVDSPSPRDLQLSELQRQVSLDIANAMGLDPEDLGLSTTSRTYANDVDRRRNKLNDVLRPYMVAITDRLSMGDVTRHGNRVRFNTAEYLLPNPTDRWAVHETKLRIGAATLAEIRNEEGLPPLEGAASPISAEPAEIGGILAQAGHPDGDAAGAGLARLPAATFSAEAELVANLPLARFRVDPDKRIIEGVALPWGAVAENGGHRYRFARGSLKAAQTSRVKLLRDHDRSQAIGVAVRLQDTPNGYLARFKVARGPAGDEALQLAEDGVLDGLSVGVDFLADDTAVDPNDDTVVVIRRADLREVSLTAMPAFDDARVTKVAASRGKSHMTTDTDTEIEEPGEEVDGDTGETEAEAGGVTLTQDQLTALLSRPGALDSIMRRAQPAPATSSAPEGALVLAPDQVDQMVRSGAFAQILGLGGTPTPVEPERKRVNPTRTVKMAEPEPYRFDRDGNLRPGSHDFSDDLILAGRDHNEAAYRRALTFIQKQFDTDTADVNELNYPVNRPDLYVDQLDYVYPLWQSINRGAIANVTPFVVPKFSSSSGLVGDHTEGTEPTAGTFVTTSQTITPTPLSGKAEITRETWDQGGNPQVSALIWQQMVREWNEELESATATFLNTLTAAVDINLGVATADAALQSAWNAAMAGLQFARGGHRFRMFGVHIDLYLAFVDAVDGNDRPLFPQLNPQNASGMATPRFGLLDLGGVIGVPSWALGASGTAAANSWLFNPEDIHGWASAPQRLQFDYQVKQVEIGIWGYKAFANTRIDGVRQVIYDPVA